MYLLDIPLIDLCLDVFCLSLIFLFILFLSKFVGYLPVLLLGHGLEINPPPTFFFLLSFSISQYFTVEGFNLMNLSIIFFIMFYVLGAIDFIVKIFDKSP